MKKLFYAIFIIGFFACCKSKSELKIYTSDVDNYWKAYDKITSTNDTELQQKHLQEIFIDSASIGQKALFKARNYKPKEFIENIRKYPKFWESIRTYMLNSNKITDEIKDGVSELKNLYPELKPAQIYFGIGAFRTPGTIVDSLVLIGSEYAFSNPKIDASEFEENHPMQNYHKNNKIEYLGFSNVHEYVHTQQFKNHNLVLIKTCLFEGIPEFIAKLATNKDSFQPCMKYGKENDDFIKNELKKHLFSVNDLYNWLWNSPQNTFNMRDVGYYVGYTIAKGFYNQSKDKKQAIKELIELDFSDDEKFNRIINASEYFKEPISKLKKEYYKNAPKVIGIREFENGSQNVDANITNITIEFSQSMQKRTGFELGSLGMDGLMRVQKLREVFSDKEKKRVSFEVKLKPNKRYQLAFGSNFKNLEGIAVQPYLIDFKTSE